jgi:hypothetical protein
MKGFKNMFLTPQDLRIGNYINYEMTIHVVDEIHQDKLIHHWVNANSDGYVTRYNQILSIPLTAREIEDLGFIEDFKRIRNTEGYFDNQGYFLEDNGSMGFRLNRHDDEDCYTFITHVEFVHELQNIYFDLTKRLLTYKE